MFAIRWEVEKSLVIKDDLLLLLSSTNESPLDTTDSLIRVRCNDGAVLPPLQVHGCSPSYRPASPPLRRKAPPSSLRHS